MSKLSYSDQFRELFRKKTGESIYNDISEYNMNYVDWLEDELQDRIIIIKRVTKLINYYKNVSHILIYGLAVSTFFIGALIGFTLLK